jgi:hypothetical protein
MGNLGMQEIAVVMLIASMLLIIPGVLYLIALQRAFRACSLQRRTMEPDPGKSLGLATCILSALTVVPILGALAGVGALICWILYWMKVVEFTTRVATSAPTPAS